MSAVEAIARVCHEVNRAYCAALGDTSQVPWEDAPEWQRESAISGVKAVLDDPAMTPERTHELWSADKLGAGWVYGLLKDPCARTHPCLVAYDALPAEQRVKDALFLAVVRAMQG